MRSVDILCLPFKSVFHSIFAKAFTAQVIPMESDFPQKAFSDFWNAFGELILVTIDDKPFVLFLPFGAIILFFLIFRLEADGLKIGIRESDKLWVVAFSAVLITIGLHQFSKPLSSEAFAKVNNNIQVLKGRGKELSEEGKYDESVPIYAKTVSLLNGSISELSVLSDELSNLNNYKGAALAQKKIVALLDSSQNVENEERAEARLRYSATLYQANSYEEASALVGEALQLGGSEAIAYGQLCFIYLELDRAEQSVESCDEALLKDTGSDILIRAWLWYERGLALDKAGEPSKALESLLFSYSLLDNSGKQEEQTLREKIEAKVNEYDSFLTKDILTSLKNSKTEEGIPVTLQREEKFDPPPPPPIQEKDEAVVSLLKKFPLDECGSLENNRDLSDELYPIFVEYTEDNLESIKKDFCKDAYLSNEGDIQVASLKNKALALRFQSILKERFGNARIGQPEAVR